jgi:hypothetical protein
LKNKILIGSHNIDCSGSIRESRYRHTKSQRFDGIHLYGSSGMKAYYKSVIDVLKSANLAPEDFDHQDCPQFHFQKKQNYSNSRYQKQSKGGPNGFGNRNLNPRNQKSTPTYNRFDAFSNNLGNNQWGV